MAALATPAFAQTKVPSNWSLKPTGLTTGGEFRLLFLSSTKRSGSASAIATYNTFIQGRAAAGHTNIRDYSTGFRVVGCTAAVDATANTSTTGTGVAIYWLGGTKVADTYTDFYDGSWDDEANDKNESGTNGLDTSVNVNKPITGCAHDGTESFSSGNSRSLGASSIRIGEPNDSTSNSGPLSSSTASRGSSIRPMYGLSEVFEVAAANSSATGALTITGTPQFGNTLTAGTTAIMDANGLTTVSYTYQWIRVDGGAETNISGERASTYTLMTADVGKTIKVKVSFTDDDNYPETRTSAATAAVTANNPPMVANAIPDQEATGGMAFSYMLPNNTFSDTDSDMLTYMATKADASALPTWLSFDAGTRIFSGMPQDADAGTVSVRVTVSDGKGGSVSDEFDITVVDTTPPTLTRAFVPSNGQQIQLRFSENLQLAQLANLPPANAFDVTVDGSSVTVSSVVPGVGLPGVGAFHLVVSPVIIGQGQTVVITYTDPTVDNDTNAIQDTAGNDTATFTTGRNSVPAVTNNSTVDTTPPTLTRSVVASNGLSMVLEFSENVDQSNRPPAAAFTVTADSSDVTVSGVLQQSALGNFRIALVSPVIRQGQAVVVAYEDPTAGNDTNAIQDTVGNDTPDFTTGRSGVPVVTNNSTVTTTVPGAPTGLTATASGNTRINLTWTAPGSTGGSAITGYKIEVSPDGINNWTTLEADTRSTTTTYPHTGLAAGSIRYYRVSAINVVGAGTPSNIDNATTGTTGQTTVTFGASSYTAVEGGAAATVAVDLSVAPSAPVTIPLTTAAYLGNAAAADHSAIPANLTFTTGQTRRTFTVTATDDTYEDGGESVRLGFGTLPAGYAPGAHRTATVALADNDASLVVDFGTHFAHIVQVRESRDVQHQFRVLLSRWQHSINAKDPMTIPLVVTHVGDATAADYTAIPASVTIEVGKSEAAFSMRAIPDRTIESGEGLRIDFGALPGARKGRWGPYETVEFLDELTVSFGASSYTAAENGDPAMVEVKLGAVQSAVVTIPLVVTYQGGATAADHTVIPASVTFTTGQTQQTFMVTATADSDADSGEKLTIAFGRSLPLGLRPPAGGNCCATAEIEFVDHDPDSGKPTITGTPAAGETLTADVSEIDDVDGLPAVTTYTYQWIRVVDGSESDISGATLSTYTLQSEDEGNKVKVKVSFIDQGGTAETRTSEEYPSSGTINEEGETSPADVPAPPPFSLPTEEEIVVEEPEEGCAVSDVTGDDQSLERFVECAAGRIEDSDTFTETLRLLEGFRDDEGNWNDGSTYLVLLTARGGVYFHADNREVEDLDWFGILSCEGEGSVLDTEEGCFIEYEEERRGYAHPLSASHVPLARDEAEFVLLGGFNKIPEEGKPFTGMIGEPSTEAGDVDTDDRLRKFVEGAGRVLMEALEIPELTPRSFGGF